VDPQNLRAINSLRKLVEEKPARYNPSLASSLHRIAVNLGLIDRHDEALVYSLECVELRQKLAEEKP
jgi:hypothetical protein